MQHFGWHCGTRRARYVRGCALLRCFSFIFFIWDVVSLLLMFFFFKRHSKLCCCGFVILFTRVEILNLSTVVLMSYWWAFMYQFFTFNFKKLNKKITTNIAEDYTFFRLLLNNHSTGWTLEPFVWQSFFAYHQWYETFRQPVITCRQSLFGWNFNFKFWWTYNFFLYIFCIHFRTLSDTIYFLSHLWGVDP